MQLSDTDKKLVARLKKQQEQFLRWRWVGLIGALFFIGIGIYGFVIVDGFAQEPALPSVMAIAFLSPVVFLLQVGGFALLIYLVTFWRGKPETRLLLRLLEDSRDAA